MAVYTDLKSAIYNAIKPLFPNNEVTWMYGNGDEPSNPYVGLHILSMDQRGREQTSTSAIEQPDGSNSYILNTVVTYEALIQIMFKGSTAGDLVHEFSQNFNSQQAYFYLRKNNLGKMRVGVLRNAPQMRETKYVPTFLQDLTLSYAAKTSQPVEYIEQVILVNTQTGDRFEIPETIG
ncbi:MAG: hypothetical protein PUP93_06695 [Rhizonema sp. NSF051]|nr:hypothetical protein [Rhizonema sp. NSF051]